MKHLQRHRHFIQRQQTTMTDDRIHLDNYVTESHHRQTEHRPDRQTEQNRQNTTRTRTRTRPQTEPEPQPQPDTQHTHRTTHTEPQPEPEHTDRNRTEPDPELLTLLEAFGTMDTDIKTTYTLYIYPIIGDVKAGDIIGVFVDDEYRGDSTIDNVVLNDINVLFCSIVVQTRGIDNIISSLKVFHYVTSTKGYVTTIDFSDKNFHYPLMEIIRQRSYILIFLHMCLNQNQNQKYTILL